MKEIEKVTNSQAKARSIYNSLIKDNIFYTGISKNLAIALIELGIDSSTTDKLPVEKLQEQLNTAKKAPTEIRANIEEHNQIYDLSVDTALLLEGIDGIAFEALAAIGGDDE